MAPTPKWAWLADQQRLTLVKYILRTLLKVNADGHAVFKLLHKPQDKKKHGDDLNRDSCDTGLNVTRSDIASVFRQCPAEVLQLKSYIAK